MRGSGLGLGDCTRRRAMEGGDVDVLANGRVWLRDVGVKIVGVEPTNSNEVIGMPRPTAHEPLRAERREGACRLEGGEKEGAGRKAGRERASGKERQSGLGFRV